MAQGYCGSPAPPVALPDALAGGSTMIASGDSRLGSSVARSTGSGLGGAGRATATCGWEASLGFASTTGFGSTGFGAAATLGSGAGLGAAATLGSATG
jgi:hypothetical protein